MLSWSKANFLYIFTLTRVAPLAARPGGQLSIVQVARQVYDIPIAQGNPFARANASTLDSRHNHFIFQKQKRTAMGAFSFLEQVKGGIVCTLPRVSKPIILPIFWGFLGVFA